MRASGFYEWLNRPESNRAMSNRALLVRIRESFEASHQTYGSPRMWRDLRDWNVPCSENRVARLMRQAGLVARPRLRRPPFDLGQRSMIAPNILDWAVRRSTGPNQKWVADFTKISNRRRLAVPGGGSGPLFADGSGMVDAKEHDHAAGRGCNDDGVVVATP